MTIAIVLIHYLLTADGTPPADRWLAFRELPDGLFYAQAFAGHTEGEIAQKLGADIAGFRHAAAALGGQPLDLADASFRFQALPRLAVAVLLWAGDDEFPAQARVCSMRTPVTICRPRIWQAQATGWPTSSCIHRDDCGPRQF